MKESYSFEPIKKEIEKKKESPIIEPLTAIENEKEATENEKEMTLKDHWFSLRQSIQEKVLVREKKEDEQDEIKLLSELITPALMAEYKQILKGFNGKAKKSEEHLQREFIDVNEEIFSANIESWIENLIVEVRDKKGNDFNENENEIEELRTQCWLLFDSIGNVMNTKSIEMDVVDFFKNSAVDKNKEKESAKQEIELIADLQKRYPLDKIELEILVNLISTSDDEGKNYSPKILVETISRLWNEYELGEKKGAIAKISLGYLMSKGVNSFAPSLFQNVIAHDKFNLAVFLEYNGLNKISDVIDAKMDVELAKLMSEINHRINERITNSLFFQEFEFIHEKSLGEIFATLERGKNSTEMILQDSISRFAPVLTGIAMSLVFLTKINPALGVIGIGSLPFMYKVAKKQNAKIMPMYGKERREGERIETKLGSIKSGFEEVKTSPDASSVAHHVKEQLNTRDILSMERSIEEIKMRLKRMIPFDVATVVAAGVGFGLQEVGMIPGGAVLSNIIYSNQLNYPIQELVQLYFDQFARYIQDIQRMEEIFGKYEKLDLPEGEKERNRIAVSELKNLDIIVKDLQFKDILRGVNLEIKQGEFLSIAGASGAGKSTLLRNLVGLYKPDKGSVEIGGTKNDEIKKYGEGSIYSIMSYCNQDPQIFEGMTLRENLLLWSKEEIADEKIKKVLGDLHLDKFMGRLDEEVTHFSGGEKVRIGVARTLIKGAKIMLLDEPTASLDSQAGTEVRKIISEIHEKYSDTTIICVSHDEELIKSSKRSINMTELQK
ncbi:MAG: ABC transporter ATP-binding protein [Candidatus Moraniibacteriota bacterium]